MLLTVTEITTLDEVLELAGAEAASGIGQLEWPQEVGCLTIKIRQTKIKEQINFTYLLEVGAGADDLVDQVLNTEDVILAEVLLNDLVVSEGDALFGNFAVSTLVNQFADCFEISLAE